MTTVKDRLETAVAELERSVDRLPDRAFRPAALKLANLVVTVVAAIVVLALVAIPALLIRVGSGEVVDQPSSTTSAPSTTAAPVTARAVLRAELGNLILISPVLLDDGTIVARAQRIIEPTEWPEEGFGRSADGGATWSFVSPEKPTLNSGWEIAAVGNVLVAPATDAETGGSYVLTSRDSGASWFAAELAVPDDYLASSGMRMPAVTVDTADRFVLYSGNGVWVSSDGVNWEGSLRDNSYRSLWPTPQMVDDVLVVSGEDGRIYAAAPDQALEVVMEPGSAIVSLAARDGAIVAWASASPDAPTAGTWIGSTTDGFIWTEHPTDLSFSVVHPLSVDLGGGYLGITRDQESGATVYRSPNLTNWTEIALIESGDEATISQVVETEGGLLALAWGEQQTLWFIGLTD